MNIAKVSIYIFIYRFIFLNVICVIVVNILWPEKEVADKKAIRHKFNIQPEKKNYVPDE